VYQEHAKRNRNLPKEPKIGVLLVDDHADGLLTLETVLDSPEYALLKAGSASETLLHLKEQEVAVILMSVQMSPVDGFQVASLIKEEAAWKDIPILFVTSVQKDLSYIRQAYSAGAVDYIFKPFDPYILQSKVAVFVGLSRRHKKIQHAQEELRCKEEELHRAQKLEAIGRLAGGIAHDFNNISAGILGICEELRDTLAHDDPRKDDLSEVIKASNRALALTDQLLAYARRQTIVPEVLDLNNVISGMQGMLTRLIREDIPLDIRLESRLANVYADRGHLEEVLVNLVVNARDAIRESGRITIQTALTRFKESDPEATLLDLPAGSYIVLSVSDTGCGMSEEVLDHLFEPFYTTKEKEKGTGLGLATVYGIVKQSGGDIQVQSRQGQGTQIDIYLPLAAQTVQKEQIPKPESTLPKGPETILIAEDDHLVRRVVTNLLRKQGYKVLEAGGGPEALTLCEQHPYPIDLLVTDVVMPELNGRELADRIRAQQPHVGVLYMSGYPEEDIIAHQSVLEPGISFIEKSNLSSKLALKVKEVLQACRPLQV
jgi:signal transduction histidine kinase